MSLSPNSKFASRRQLILGAGGALVLAGSGLTYRVLRQPQSAFAPWNLSDGPVEDVRLDAFRHAILAPNPHNRQPWVIKLVGADQALIHCDLDRRLPVTDPFDRQITIGFGCFVGLAEVAASKRGYVIDVTPFPDGEPAPRLDARPVAHLRFRRVEGLAVDPLAEAILARRSNKQPYDMARPVLESVLSQIAAASVPGITIGHSSEPGLTGQLRGLIWEAMKTELITPRTFRESVDLIRIGAPEIDANPDGIAVRGPMMEALALAGQVSREQIADMSSTAFKTTYERYAKTFASTPSFFWISAQGTSRKEELAAGAAYVRANLAATRLGLSMQPVSQAIQEYPEMTELRLKLRTMLGVERVHMLMRLGYAPSPEPTPRWPLETRIAVR